MVETLGKTKIEQDLEKLKNLWVDSKITFRTYQSLRRAYAGACQNKRVPLNKAPSEMTDRELLEIRHIGPKRLREFRLFFPSPEKPAIS